MCLKQFHLGNVRHLSIFTKISFKGRVFLWSKLNCYQHNMHCYIYKMFYVSLKVTNHKAKTIRFSCRFTKYKEKRMKAYHHRQSSVHKGRQQERKKWTRKLQNSQKTINKIALVSPYLSIITLNVNRLTFPVKKDTEWMDALKKKKG